jgi:type I restriction enzyme, S subunit
MREDWIEIELGAVCDFVGGGTPSKRESSYWNGKIPWASIKDVKGDELHKTQDFITKEGLSKSASNLARIGEIILATRINPGKPILSKIEAAINQDLKIVKPKIEIDTKYLFYGFKTLERKVVQISSGTTVLGINLNNLKAIEFGLCSLPEQRDIVAKIEELFTDLDKGLADLKKAQEQLVVYRQAVLKKAFEGELTSAKMVFRTLDSLTSIITKGASPKWQGFDYTTDKKELLFITSENVREGYVSLEKEKYLPVGFNEIQKRSVLQKGDVLFNIVGASIGRAAIFNLDKLSNINQAVALIRLNEEILNQYVNYFLNSEGAKQEYLKKQVEVARANISLQNVKDIEIPFCIEAEQRRVIQEIESRLSFCDKVEQSIEESLEKAKALRQSILKKAFEGKLLSKSEIAKCKQAKDYETASVLVKRIKSKIHGQAQD